MSRQKNLSVFWNKMIVVEMKKKYSYKINLYLNGKDVGM